MIVAVSFKDSFVIFSVGRDYYHFDKKIDIERYNLTIFPGISTNVNIYEGSLMVNVDVSHKVCQIDISIIFDCIETEL